MRLTERQDFYDDLLAQITLATLHRLFQDASTRHLQSLVFNGYVEGIHPATGHKQNACILTVQAGRKEFQKLKLKQVTPLPCIQNLKGLLLKPLADLVPVEPIRVFQSMEDERFIRTKDIVAKSASMVDLATMPWEAFEHLVAQLFEKI
jgi:restriction system protein